MCGNVRYEAQGNLEASVGNATPSEVLVSWQAQVLCHCIDCRKIGGSTYSSNAIFPEDGFKVTKGTPKQHKKVADGGNEIISNFWCVFNSYPEALSDPT
jgi:hypothetical protein